MQKGQRLVFNCISCQHPVPFSIFELEKTSAPLSCGKCKKQYALNDNDLKRQLQKFEALCRQIIESEEILGNVSIGIDIGNHQVKIPYKLLLTRLNSSMDLMIGDRPVSIVFRMEPSVDILKFQKA